MSEDALMLVRRLFSVLIHQKCSLKYAQLALNALVSFMHSCLFLCDGIVNAFQNMI